MMIYIYFFTSTRAEYGLMKPLIERMSKDQDIIIKILVSGTHLSEKHGYTIDEIRKDNFAEICEIDIMSKNNDANAVSETMANAIVKFSAFLSNDRPDYLFIDGDRYESLAVAIAAVNNNIPIIHNGGGCTTEGAADEYYRHAITKMSMLHFTSTQLYRKRIIQMGESPSRVFAVGSLGIENIYNAPLLSKTDLARDLKFDLRKPYAVLTYHPVTLENNSYEYQIKELVKSIDSMKNLSFIITGANSDNGGDTINSILQNYCTFNKNAIFVQSLGMIKYLSAIKYSEFVIGNSSSGLIEAPSFGIPTINIGDRQKGRIRAESIIDCNLDASSILNAIDIATNSQFKEKCKSVVNPNGDGNTSERIVSEIKKYYNVYGTVVQKKFYDIGIN